MKKVDIFVHLDYEAVDLFSGWENIVVDILFLIFNQAFLNLSPKFVIINKYSFASLYNLG